MNSPCVNCGADAKVCKECDWYNGRWISKDQYEVKLKANMVAMLTKIQLEIEESPCKHSDRLGDYSDGVQKGIDIIQHKIDKLKEGIMGMTSEEATENVNHPKHYNITGRKECIVEMLEKFGVDAVITFCTLNAYKYRYRHELKNGQEDLEKAKWYENYALKLKE